MRSLFGTLPIDLSWNMLGYDRQGRSAGLFEGGVCFENRFRVGRGRYFRAFFSERAFENIAAKNETELNNFASQAKVCKNVVIRTDFYSKLDSSFE